MKLIDTPLKKTSEKGFGVKPVWDESEVVISSTNAFSEQVVDVFRVSLKQIGNETILVASATAYLYFSVPDSWADKKLVPFAEYDGRYDDVHIAGAGGSFRDVQTRGRGIGVVDAAALQTTHLDYLGDDYDEL